jgi:TolB-like protein/Tfp pilus assembly protein PilF/predicted Ser/Thr protein kinase
MARKCPRCNADNPETATFCADCGTQLPATVEISSSHTKTLLTFTKDPIKGITFAGRYRLVEELGRGGMGVVYKAEDTKLKRTVALKFLPPELTHIPDVKDRFMREAQAAAALDHPNICTVYEFDEAEEKTFISMAYVEGQSLRKKLESGPLELDEALRIATQVAQGLQIAHKKGVVHRDIKSANIMVTEDNQAKIMDFGLARMSGGTLITQEGTAMGTIAYMSPEQAQGGEVDHRTDIWSFGVVLYEMFGGQLPFKGEQDQAVVYSILNKKPKPLTELRAEIPVSIGQVVDKALEKNPDERYQQIDELLDDLKSISAGIVPEEIKVRLRKAKRHRRKQVVLYTVASGLAIAMVVIAFNLFMGGRAEAIESIAVLPFENLTGDKGKDYFADGATDEVIGQLSKIGAWRVISRTSVMHYKGVDKPLAEIARELNVDVVVEGTVYQTGENVRIGMKLIDVLPEEQNLWADTYDRPMTDVLIMYSEIAQTIANKTQVNLSYEEITHLTSASQVNPESYDAYLKGKFHYDKTTPEGIKLALQYFELAIEIDPNNALAHVGIARVWGGRYQLGLTPRHEALPLTKAALEKALEIDNTQAEAHHVLAGTICWNEWDWEGAETEFQQALRLNPNLADAHAFYSHLLCIMGRTEEALPHIELALELDPLNPLYYGLYGVVLVYNRRFDEALAAARTSLDMVPGHSVGRFALKDAFISKGMYDELMAHHRERFTKYPERAAALEDGFEKAGYKGAYRALGDLLVKLFGKPERGVIRAWDIARHYIVSGDHDLAIDWLEKAYEDYEPNLPYIGMPSYDPLRSYPRFQELLRKMNLPVDKKK